jgi:uncharacterized protein YggE
MTKRLFMRGTTLAIVCGSWVGAQEPMRPMVPQIVTTASGEVRVAPDRATIQIGVQSRATTAAAAATQNSQKQQAIIDAIKARGVPAAQITTSNFNVIPETRYDREGQAAPRTTSYLVINTVTVELRRIDQVGPVIDAALAAGERGFGASCSIGRGGGEISRRCGGDGARRGWLDWQPDRAQFG